MKLAIGTAQFGMDYGINNERGKVPKDEAFRILDLCIRSGIDTIDTAAVYGSSERVLGEYVGEKGAHFNIVSKFPVSYGNDPEAVIKRSLDDLHAAKLYGYLFHDICTFTENEGIWSLFNKMKSDRKIDKIGFSLYRPNDLRDIMDRGIRPDILQVPYNIFDRRFEPYFKELREAGVEIHARSVFLQGLAFKDPRGLEGNLKRMTPKLERLRSLAGDNHNAIARICLAFVLSNADIDKVIIGVDSLENLMELIDISFEGPSYNAKDLMDLIELDEDLILPFNWRV